jgi:hypothetical protein
MMKSALFLGSVPQAAVTGKRLGCLQVGVVLPMSFLPPLATTSSTSIPTYRITEPGCCRRWRSRCSRRGSAAFRGLFAGAGSHW